MPAVKNVGEPCAGEPHARFDAAAGGNQTSRASTRRTVQAPPADPTATARCARRLRGTTSRSGLAGAALTIAMRDLRKPCRLTGEARFSFVAEAARHAAALRRTSDGVEVSESDTDVNR
jgi:hypothetical protein